MGGCLTFRFVSGGEFRFSSWPFGAPPRKDSRKTPARSRCMPPPENSDSSSNLSEECLVAQPLLAVWFCSPQNPPPLAAMKKPPQQRVVLLQNPGPLQRPLLAVSMRYAST